MGNPDVKLVMISNGLQGKENPSEYVDRCRLVVADYYASLGEEVQIINTYFNDYDGNRLQFLGKSITEGLAVADEIVFMDDWENHDGCSCENFIANKYGVSCIYLTTD